MRSTEQKQPAQKVSSDAEREIKRLQMREKLGWTHLSLTKRQDPDVIEQKRDQQRSQELKKLVADVNRDVQIRRKRFQQEQKKKAPEVIISDDSSAEVVDESSSDSQFQVNSQQSPPLLDPTLNKRKNGMVGPKKFPNKIKVIVKKSRANKTKPKVIIFLPVDLEEVVIRRYERNDRTTIQRELDQEQVYDENNPVKRTHIRY